jgi:hypothetical protein
MIVTKRGEGVSAKLGKIHQAVLTGGTKDDQGTSNRNISPNDNRKVTTNSDRSVPNDANKIPPSNQKQASPMD